MIPVQEARVVPVAPVWADPAAQEDPAVVDASLP
ncbi:hypothetical protein IAD21_01191 [Abditibacteriota bacterium]|nr:hypothetical protein IAD21_01191 [Abditibacteriota bacterium]